MSYIRFQQMCNACGKDWWASFGIVGRTQIGSGALKNCPHCDSSDIQNVPAIPAIERLKPRFSFVGVNHKLLIDNYIWTSTLQYVKDQIAIMKRHGSEPNPPLSEQEFNDLAYTVAEYPQTIRNLQKKAEAKNEVSRTGTVSKIA